MPDPREPLGRLVHEQRIAHNAELDRPFILEPWETRSPRQRELDMLIGAAVRDRVLNAAPGRGELVRETWVYWALEQPDVAEHPNWLKSWAELDERDREVDDRIYAAVAGVVRERFRAALREHYLAGITCDGTQERDNPVCGCSRVFLGWHPSVGEAREAWIRHVLGVVDGDKISDEKEASQP